MMSDIVLFKQLINDLGKVWAINSIGPDDEPSGTEHRTGRGVDITPPTVKDCMQPERYERNHDSGVPHRPMQTD